MNHRQIVPFLPKVKLCGTTSERDRIIAEEAGVDYFGVVIEIDYSPRSRTIEEAIPIFRGAKIPGVVLIKDWKENEIREIIRTLNPAALQFLGEESPSLMADLREKTGCELWKSLHLPVRGEGSVDLREIKERIAQFTAAGVDAFIFDTVDTSEGFARHGGTGKVSEWRLVRELMRGTTVFTFLAGGIKPDNVREAITTVHPKGIDLCSGVEALPGKRDALKVRKLMENIQHLEKRR
jgi:phosphoribosylanthranilate isomerase